MKVGRRPESPWDHGPRSERVENQALEAASIIEQMRTLLAGRPPEVQGAVLAELLATWIAGHVDPTSEELTARLRAEFLTAHINGVEELVPVIAKGMGLPW